MRYKRNKFMVKYQVLKSEMGQIPMCALPWKMRYHLILTLGLFSSNLSWKGKVLWNAPITDPMMPVSCNEFCL